MCEGALPALEVVFFGAMPPEHELPDWIDYRLDPSQDELFDGIYNTSSIFLCTSEVEGFGLTSIEAMAGGAALITTDNGGSHDYAFHDRTTLVEPSPDADALAEHVVDLLHNDARTRAHRDRRARLPRQLQLGANRRAPRSLPRALPGRSRRVRAAGVLRYRGSMRFTAEGDDGSPIEFECADTITSRWVSNTILAGKTYPVMPFVDDVQVVFDVGANCGATSVYFARHYPEAQVHSFEPGSEPRAFLERNAAAYPNVAVHPIGLYSSDRIVPLYKGDGDTVLGSVVKRSVNLDESEPVKLRAGGSWAAEHGIERIDVLKVDVELCEVDVIESLAALLPTVKVLYVEYGSRQIRREVARLLDPTHELYAGVMFLDQGECVYLNRELVDLDAATLHLRQAFASGRAAQAT